MCGNGLSLGPHVEGFEGIIEIYYSVGLLDRIEDLKNFQKQLQV